MRKLMYVCIIGAVFTANVILIHTIEERERLIMAEEENTSYISALVKAHRAIILLETEKRELHKDNARLQKELKDHKDRSVQVASVSDDTKVIEGFELTWYNYNSGRTATGAVPKDNHTIAVDPKVIPLHTWVIIEMPNGELKKRYTEDTGGAVKGKIIDEYDTASTSELLKRGRSKGVKVYVLGE